MNETRATEHEAPDPLRYYWLPGSRVHHVVVEGSRLTMCGRMVRPSGRLTTYRPKGYRVCYNCLYVRDSDPFSWKSMKERAG